MFYRICEAVMGDGDGFTRIQNFLVIKDKLKKRPKKLRVIKIMTVVFDIIDAKDFLKIEMKLSFKLRKTVEDSSILYCKLLTFSWQLNWWRNISDTCI